MSRRRKRIISNEQKFGVSGMGSELAVVWQRGIEFARLVPSVSGALGGVSAWVMWGFCCTCG